MAFLSVASTPISAAAGRYSRFARLASPDIAIIFVAGNPLRKASIASKPSDSGMNMSVISTCAGELLCNARASPPFAATRT
jgi:hypothetical protein